MRTEAGFLRRCRRASADFGLLVLGCACTCIVWAKDVEAPVQVAAPKPVVMQPTLLTPAPALASEVAPPAPEAKSAKAGKAAKKAAKPVGKSKPKPKRR